MLRSAVPVLVSLIAGRGPDGDATAGTATSNSGLEYGRRCSRASTRFHILVWLDTGSSVVSSSETELRVDSSVSPPASATSCRTTGIMFWAGRDPVETLREIKAYGVRSGQLGVPGDMALDGAAEAMNLSLAVSSVKSEPVYLVDEQCHPQTIAVVSTRVLSRRLPPTVMDAPTSDTMESAT